MTLLHVYKDGVPTDFDLDESQSLSQTRQQLSANQFMTDEYQFVYWNPITQEKTVFNQPAKEARTPLSGFVMPDQQLVLANVGPRCDLFGDRTDWFHDRNTGVKVDLNLGPDGQAANAGKFQPMMLTSVTPTNPDSNFFADNVVVCEKGSIVEFTVSSWGAAGWGYSITTEHGAIADGLYATYGRPGALPYGSQSSMTLQRWMDSPNVIQIDSTSDLNITGDLIVQYQKVTVKSWNVTAYTDGTGSYSSELQPPDLAGISFAPSTALAAVAAGDGGFDPGPPGGDTYLPGGGIEPGAPHKGDKSSQQFAGGLKSLTADDPNTKVIGAVVFYFFVFDDKETANRVMQINNAPDPSIYQN